MSDLFWFDTFEKRENPATGSEKWAETCRHVPCQLGKREETL